MMEYATDVHAHAQNFLWSGPDYGMRYRMLQQAQLNSASATVEPDVPSLGEILKGNNLLRLLILIGILLICVFFGKDICGIVYGWVGGL